jgi:hypothetical protein
VVQQLIIDVPDDLAAIVSAALHKTYPTVIAGTETMAEEFRAVVAWWTANLLSEHAANQARTAGAQKVTALQAQVDATVLDARQRAWAAVQAVMTSGQIPDPSTPEPVPATPPDTAVTPT